MNTRWMKALALMTGLVFTAAACGSDDAAEPAATTVVAADDAMEDDAMEDDAMEDDAMEDDAMEDDAMEDDAMEDDAMEDDAMEDDAMEDDAMEDDAMEDDAMEDDAMEDDAVEDDAMEDDAMAMAEGTHVLHLELDGLADAGAGYDYQVWSNVDGDAVAGGAFDIDGDDIKILGGQAHLYIFDGADSVFVTVEADNRSDGATPSDDQVLAGDVDSSGNITLTGVGGSSASGTGETR